MLIRSLIRIGYVLACGMMQLASADEKTVQIATGGDFGTQATIAETPARSATSEKEVEKKSLFAKPIVRDKGTRTAVGVGDHTLPLVVVRGTPYQMGHQLGEALRTEIQAWVPEAVAGIAQELQMTQAQMQEVWLRSAAYTDLRVTQEMVGLADGAGISLAQLQALHATPLLMPYSCSSIAVWGDATTDGHLYQTRNLDWSMQIGAHNVAVIVVYLPEDGIAHVVPNFAGVVVAHTGMNAQGIVLAEMGDASAKMAPYQAHAPHFASYFRTMLYDSQSLDQALQIFHAQPTMKAYHFVFGDGGAQRRAVKIRTVGDQVTLWNDNDASDEFAPQVLPCLVYNDEGRGAFETLQTEYGKLDGEKLVALANQIPIKGGNVVNTVFDATALRMWVTYAHGDTEAYLRSAVFVDLKQYGMHP